MPIDRVPGDVAPSGARSPDLSRRAVLAASAGALPVLLAACRGVQVLGTPPPPPADVRLLRSAIESEELMVARYRAAIAVIGGAPGPGTPAAAPGTIAWALATVRDEHDQHLAELKARLIEPAGAASAPSRSPSVTLQGNQAAVLSMLEQAERTASNRLIGQLGGLPSSLAQLFASIAAAEATHVPFLQSIGRTS